MFICLLLSPLAARKHLKGLNEKLRANLLEIYERPRGLSGETLAEKQRLERQSWVALSKFEEQRARESAKYEAANKQLYQRLLDCPSTVDIAGIDKRYAARSKLSKKNRSRWADAPQAYLQHRQTVNEKLAERGRVKWLQRSNSAAGLLQTEVSTAVAPLSPTNYEPLKTDIYERLKTQMSPSATHATYRTLQSSGSQNSLNSPPLSPTNYNHHSFQTLFRSSSVPSIMVPTIDDLVSQIEHDYDAYKAERKQRKMLSKAYSQPQLLQDGTAAASVTHEFDPDEQLYDVDVSNSSIEDDIAALRSPEKLAADVSADPEMLQLQQILEEDLADMESWPAEHEDDACPERRCLSTQTSIHDLKTFLSSGQLTLHARSTTAAQRNLIISPVSSLKLQPLTSPTGEMVPPPSTVVATAPITVPEIAKDSRLLSPTASSKQRIRTPSPSRQARAESPVRPPRDPNVPYVSPHFKVYKNEPIIVEPSRERLLSPTVCFQVKSTQRVEETDITTTTAKPPISPERVRPLSPTSRLFSPIGNRWVHGMKNDFMQWLQENIQQKDKAWAAKKQAAADAAPKPEEKEEVKFAPEPIRSPPKPKVKKVKPQPGPAPAPEPVVEAEPVAVVTSPQPKPQPKAKPAPKVVTPAAAPAPAPAPIASPKPKPTPTVNIASPKPKPRPTPGTSPSPEPRARPLAGSNKKAPQPHTPLNSPMNLPAKAKAKPGASAKSKASEQGDAPERMPSISVVPAFNPAPSLALMSSLSSIPGNTYTDDEGLLDPRKLIPALVRGVSDANETNRSQVLSEQQRPYTPTSTQLPMTPYNTFTYDDLDDDDGLAFGSSAVDLEKLAVATEALQITPPVDPDAQD